MILFDKEIYVNFENKWNCTDEEGDFSICFNLFNVGCSFTSFGITICNFTICIGWY